MKPIRAYLNYTEDVPIDIDNPEHAPFLGGDYAVEKRQVPGFVTDVVILEDSVFRKVVEDKIYKDGIISSSGVYVIFWEDKGSHYRMRVEDFSSITVSASDMRNYVYTTGNV